MSQNFETYVALWWKSKNALLEWNVASWDSKWKIKKIKPIFYLKIVAIIKKKFYLKLAMKFFPRKQLSKKH